MKDAFFSPDPNPDKPKPNRFEDKKLITKARKYEDTKA